MIYKTNQEEIDAKERRYSNVESTMIIELTLNDVESTLKERSVILNEEQHKKVLENTIKYMDKEIEKLNDRWDKIVIWQYNKLKKEFMETA